MKHCATWEDDIKQYQCIPTNLGKHLIEILHRSTKNHEIQTDYIHINPTMVTELDQFTRQSGIDEHCDVQNNSKQENKSKILSRFLEKPTHLCLMFLVACITLFEAISIFLSKLKMETVEHLVSNITKKL